MKAYYIRSYFVFIFCIVVIRTIQTEQLDYKESRLVVYFIKYEQQDHIIIIIMIKEEKISQWLIAIGVDETTVTKVFYWNKVR